MAKSATKEKPAEAPAPTEATAKSIIASKYRGKYTKNTRDWLAQLLDEHATKTKDRKVTEGDGEGKTTKTVQVPDGIDTNKLHAIAEANGLDIAKLKAQSATHGYPGRARMTIRNMLQTVAKQRHGLHAGGKFHDAPAEFLNVKGAPATPTHTQDGTKIVVEKKVEPAKAA